MTNGSYPNAQRHIHDQGCPLCGITNPKAWICSSHISFFEDVKAFHRLISRSLPERPRRLDAESFARRVRLINEEWSEVTTAHALRNEAEFADGLVDLVWVVLGTAVEAGLPFDELWAEVRRANMDKRGGEVDSNGKLLKPPGWKPPQIDAILRRKFNNETAGEYPQ